MTKPKFRQPPVIEVVVAIEFVPLQMLGAVELVHLVDLWRDDYPQVQEQVALPSNPDPGSFLDGTGLQISHGPQPLRLWLLKADQRILLQVQHDRLVLNWRRRDQASYPSYEVLREEYRRKWLDLVDYVSRRQLGHLRPATAEVIFVNHVPIASPDLSSVLSALQPDASSPGSELGCQLETASLFQGLSVSSERGAGRLTIAASPIPDEKALNLTLTTRISLVDGIDDETMLKALDFAHDVGVGAFVDSTTPAMHELWGKYQ